MKIKRYKLVRIVDGRFFSANTLPPRMELEYIVGRTTRATGLGVACYKRLEDAKAPRHLRETMGCFNKGKPIAILEVEPVGEADSGADVRYFKGGYYEGGINYPAVKVIKVVARIDRL